MDEMAIEYFQGLGYDGNIYLLNGEVLIDTGTGHNRNIVLHWLKEHTAPEDIHTIIITHRHYDHSGGAVDMLEETGATAYVHELDAPPLVTGDAVTTGARAFRGEQIPISVVEILEGHTFDVQGHTLEVLHTPGHTIGSISLYSRKDGIIFSGDTIFANGGVGRWDLATGDFISLKTSISRISDLDIRDLYPGHDVPIIGNAKEHSKLSLKSMQETPLDLMMRRVDLMKDTQG